MGYEDERSGPLRVRNVYWSVNRVAPQLYCDIDVQGDGRVLFRWIGGHLKAEVVRDKSRFLAKDLYMQAYRMAVEALETKLASERRTKVAVRVYLAARTYFQSQSD